MKTREKAIVAIMVLVGLYAAWDLLLGGGGRVTGPSLEKRRAELEQFVADVTRKMAPDAPSPTVELVFERVVAGIVWPPDPFDADASTALTMGREGRGPGEIEVTFEYTGYVELGDRRLAIVNGSEYFEGDTLTDTGYQLHRILPGEIEIRAIDGENQQVIPLKEEKVNAQ